MLNLPILGSIFEALMIQALLTCLNLLCQTYTFLLQITKYTGLLFLIVIITLVCIIFLSVAKSSTNKFWSFLASAIDRPS